jgi:hypothetical protein
VTNDDVESFDPIKDARDEFAEDIERFGIEGLLWPGQLSECGFLGRDDRLADVIAADAKTVALLGVTHEQ